MPAQETWLVRVFCSTSSSHSLELAEPPGCAHLLWARRMEGGFGGEGTASAHAPQDPRCSTPLLSSGKDTHHKHHLLAALSTWHTTGLGWELPALAGGQAGNGGYSKPTGSPGLAWHSHQHREGIDWAGPLRKEPSPASSCPPSKQPRKIQQPGGESCTKGSKGHPRKTAEHLRALRAPYRLSSPRTWLFSQRLPTDKIYPL